MEFIYTRTQEDVDNARNIINEKVKKYLALTTDEIDTLSKGTCTYITLNRIENNILDIASLFRDNCGISVKEIVTKTWQLGDVFTELDIARILSNIDLLRQITSGFPDMPDTPRIDISYQTFNDIELILYHLTLLYTNIQASFSYSNEIYSGEC